MKQRAKKTKEKVVKREVKKSGLTIDERLKKIEELKKEQDECYDKAYELRDQIDNLMLEGINYEGKIIQKVEFGEEKCDYLIVKHQSFGSDHRIYLSGLCFYANFDTKDAEVAEVFFNGYHTWYYDFNDFLNLENEGSYKSIKVLDKNIFLEKIKGYTKTLENFINDWIDFYINPDKESE